MESMRLTETINISGYVVNVVQKTNGTTCAVAIELEKHCSIKEAKNKPSKGQTLPDFTL